MPAMMAVKQICLAFCTVLVVQFSLPAEATQPDAALGAYIGCFKMEKLLQTDPSLSKRAYRQYNARSLPQCSAHCKAGNFSLSIITPNRRCRCAIAIPDSAAQIRDAACRQNGTGAAVFYHHDYATSQTCKLAPLNLSADAMDFHYNSHHASFYKDSSTGQDIMQLTMEGTSGIRLAPKDSWQLYGQVEVTARVDGASGAVTAFYLRNSDQYNSDNKGNFDEIDFEWLNGHPAVPYSIWLNSFNDGVSGGEHLMRPRRYQSTLGLSANQTTASSYFKYTIHWQPSRVTWAVNGLPVLTRITGQEVKWQDMMNKAYKKIFDSPDASSHLSFSMWSDQSRYKFGGELAWDKSPYQSYFHSLRRIVCEGSSARILPQALAWLKGPDSQAVTAERSRGL